MGEGVENYVRQKPGNKPEQVSPADIVLPIVFYRQIILNEQCTRGAGSQMNRSGHVPPFQKEDFIIKHETLTKINPVIKFQDNMKKAIFFAAYLKEHISGTAKLKSTLVIVGAAMFIGVVWEFAEYIANQTLIEPFYRYFGVRAYFMGNLEDTVTDLTMDMLGAS